MNQTSTLQELSDFTKNEQSLMATLGLIDTPVESPSQTIINSILNYSKSLSFRKSLLMKEFEMNLN